MLDDEQRLDVFCYMGPEQRIPQNHLLRPVGAMADEALRDLNLLHVDWSRSA